MVDIKIGIIGGDKSDREALIKALSKIHGAKEVGSDMLQDEPIAKMQMPDTYFVERKPKSNNQWRGGSRGKGGKAKWPRR